MKRQVLKLPSLLVWSKILPLYIMGVVFIVVLLMPMIFQNDIVKTIEVSTDMNQHLAVIKGIANGTGFHWLYFGEIIVGYLFYPLANNAHLSTIYLWFNFVVLLCSGFVLYYVVKQLVNKNSALLTVGLAMFCSTGILALFKYGVIFNIISMYIILPLAILFMVRWMSNNGRWNAFFAICLFSLFSVFHSTSLYLSLVGLVMAVGFMFYPLFAKNWYLVKKGIPFCFGIIGLNLILSKLFVHVGIVVEWNRSVSFDRVMGAISDPFGAIGAILSRLSLLASNMSISVIILLLLAILGLVVQRKLVKWDKRVGLLLFVLGVFVLVLLSGLCLAGISDYNRLSLDLATVLAIVTAILLGKLLSVTKFKMLNLVVLAILAIGIIPTLVRVTTSG